MSQYPQQSGPAFYPPTTGPPHAYQPTLQHSHLVVPSPQHQQGQQGNLGYARSGSGQTQHSVSPAFSASSSTTPVRPGIQQVAATQHPQHQQQQQSFDHPHHQHRHQQQEPMRPHPVSIHAPPHSSQSGHTVPLPRPTVDTRAELQPGSVSQLQPITAGTSPSPSHYDPQHRRASSPAAVYAPNVGSYHAGGYGRPVQALQHHASDYGVYQQTHESRAPPGANGTPAAANIPAQYYQPAPPPSAGWQSHLGFPSGVRMGMPGLPPHVVRHPNGARHAGEELEQAEEEFSGMIYDPYQVKHRKRTTPEQLSVLEQAFDENNKPTAMSRKQMAEQIGMTARSVQVWFQNRRQKRKALDKKRIEEEGQVNDQGSLTPGGSQYQSWSTADQGGRVHHSSSNATGSSGEASPEILPLRSAWKGPNQAIPSQTGVPVNYAVPTVYGYPSHPQYYQHYLPQAMPHQVYPQEYQQHPQMVQQHHQYRPTSSSGQPFLGVQRGIPSISQARRGSLPYPTPDMLPAAQTNRITSSSSGGAPLPKSNIPAHMAISNVNGRRASLPGVVQANARPTSAGPFTPPRAGGLPTTLGSTGMHKGGGELTSIQDKEEHPPAGYGYIDTTVPLALQQASALASSAFDSSHPSSTPSGEAAEQILSHGPLPNPGFSFGNAMEASANNAQVNLQDNVSPSNSQASASPLDPNASYNFFLPRARMGSMASILSNVTDATTTDGSASDWERQVVMPFMNPQYGGQQVQTPLIATEVEKDKMLYPPGYVESSTPWPHYGDRRASAPPDLLQKFQTLDVERSQQVAAQQLRRSPLNSSYVARDGVERQTGLRPPVSPGGSVSRSLTESEGGDEVATIMDPHRRIKAEDSDTASNADKTPEAEERLATASPFSSHTMDPTIHFQQQTQLQWDGTETFESPALLQHSGDFHFGVDFQSAGAYEGDVGLDVHHWASLPHDNGRGVPDHYDAE